MGLHHGISGLPLKFSVPAGLNTGPQRLTISNLDGETISVDGIFNVN